MLIVQYASSLISDVKVVHAWLQLPFHLESVST